MLNMQISSIVSSLVEQELRRKGREHEALHFHFDVCMHYNHELNGKVKTFNSSRALHLLYWSLPYSNWITVFSGVSERPRDRIGKVKQWKHEISHDTCWRNDHNGFSQVYFDMADHINSQLKEVEIAEVPPCQMHESNHSAWLDRLYQWVPVKVCGDPDDPRHYRKLVSLT